MRFVLGAAVACWAFAGVPAITDALEGPGPRQLTAQDVARFIAAYKARSGGAGSADYDARAIEQRLNHVRSARADALDWIHDIAPKVELPPGARYLPSCSRALTIARQVPTVLATYDIQTNPADDSPSRAALNRAIEFYRAGGLQQTGGTAEQASFAGAGVELQISARMTAACEVAPTGANVIITGRPQANNSVALGDAEFKALTDLVVQAWNDWKNPSRLQEEIANARTRNDQAELNALMVRQENARLVERQNPFLAPIMEKITQPVT
jgi:hypothetical protein